MYKLKQKIKGAILAKYFYPNTQGFIYGVSVLCQYHCLSNKTCPNLWSLELLYEGGYQTYRTDSIFYTDCYLGVSQVDMTFTPDRDQFYYILTNPLLALVSNNN